MQHGTYGMWKRAKCRCHRCCEYMAPKLREYKLRYLAKHKGHDNSCDVCKRRYESKVRERAKFAERYRAYDKARAHNPDRIKARRAFSKSPKGKAYYAKRYLIEREARLAYEKAKYERLGNNAHKRELKRLWAERKRNSLTRTDKLKIMEKAK